MQKYTILYKRRLYSKVRWIYSKVWLPNSIVWLIYLKVSLLYSKVWPLYSKVWIPCSEVCLCLDYSEQNADYAIEKVWILYVKVFLFSDTCIHVVGLLYFNKFTKFSLQCIEFWLSLQNALFLFSKYFQNSVSLGNWTMVCPWCWLFLNIN